MAAARAKYADNPELDALKKGLNTTGRRRSGPSQQDEYRGLSPKASTDYGAHPRSA